jgi:hypothetical protein
VTEDIGAGTTETWTADNEYVLNTIVYVQTNATLVIEPGTVIKGGTNAANLVAREDIPNLVSALWVTRGGRIMAQGTREEPILFTMEGDDVNDPDDVPPTLTGQWGGVVIMGRAPINTANDEAGDVSDPKFDLYEGVDGPGPNFEHAFGGDDPEDDSGVMRYVSIRHTGNVFAPARELNSLSMGAVGRGTVIEYVESYAGSDDGFEFWGGTVNTKWLVAAFIEDDDFDTDQGYSGTNQFWFGIKPPWQGSSDSRGFETDGDLDQNNTGEEPISEWAVYNATLIGRGMGEMGFGGGVAWNPRDEASPKVYDSVVTAFAEGVRLEDLGKSLKHLILPALAVGFRQAAYTTRLTRSSMLDEINKEYVDTARSLGLPERKVLYKYTLRNALIPTLTISGIQLYQLLGGTVVIETIFAWPGIGRAIFEAIVSRDFPLIQAGVLVLATFAVTINLLVDLMYRLLNPRVRLA